MIIGTIEIAEEKRRNDFPGGPVVETSPSSGRVTGLIPGQENKVPRASRPQNRNIKQKQYCNKFNKSFKMVHAKKRKS